MKASELREMSVAELNKKLADLKQELFNLRFQHAINQLENPIRINAVKKDIARVMTALAEKAQRGRFNDGTEFEKDPCWHRCVRQDG